MDINFPEYDFPCRLYDFKAEKEIKFENYRELEKYIQELILSSDIRQIKDGLSNVLYWGYYRIGYGKRRLRLFRESVTDKQLQQFKEVMSTDKVEPLNLKKIGIPQFSGFSFISKIMMFSDPTRYVVLDKKIMELQDPDDPYNPLTNIPYNEKDSVIRVSQISQKYYFRWCELCIFIASQLPNNNIAVDIEKGFFKLVELNRVSYGRKIISSEIMKLNAQS